ncbi:MAG TPA: MBL fold metallo-hydrolase, partial [Dissulfurispiraceae bacterium]|nr:MBL fold metallo-hydrolase [Dissulfurispiraceae bacterium]
MRIQFIGGVRTVTGSCTRLTVNDLEILVDCGLHQGRDMDERNRTAFLFDPRQIDILFLTHAHIDHSGLIPRLVRDGFRGKILTTSATADLVEIMLYDSAEIQEKDAEWLTKKSFRSGRDIVYEPLYRTEDVKAALPLIDRQAYGSINHLGKGVKYRFVDAGHILGSGSLEIWYQDSPVEKRIVFSGDIGKSGNPIINDPQQVEEADYVVMESTYGNREHKDKEKSIDELVDAITTTFKRGGNVLIPAFAVGRTQDLLYVLNNLVREGRLRRCDVYVDSPLAEEATKIYLAHPECYDEEARRLFRERKTEALRLHFTGSVEESQKINRILSGAIIIAGSGMCDGGRIRHHLKHNLWRKECSIVFVGFQARGSLGREIVDGDREVRIFGEEVGVNASVYTIGGFSAHADRRELLGWLRAFRNKPEVFVVHGEDEVSLGFAETVRETFDLTV